MGRSLMQALALAVLQIRNRRHEFMTLEHILLAITYEKTGQRILADCNIDIHELRKNLEQYLDENMTTVSPEDKGEIMQTPAVTRVLERCLREQAQTNKQAEIGNFLIHLYTEQDSWAAYFIKKQGVILAHIKDIVSREKSLSSTPIDNIIISDISEMGDDLRARKPNKDKAEAGEENQSALDLFAIDLIAKAKAGKIDPLIGRENELQRTLEVLSRRKKNNPLFLGEPGTGKTAIAEGVALAIANGDVPEDFKNCKVFALDMGALLAGAKYRGDFENRLKQVVKELQNMSESILVIDEIHTLVGAGATSGGSMDASNLLKPILASGDLRCIGSTTYEEYRNHFEKDRALSRRFQVIDIKEPSRDDCLAILQGLQKYYEKFHNVKYGKGVLEAAVDLSIKYMQDRLLPDKAIDILDEVAASVKLGFYKTGKTQSKTRALPITVKHIEETIARMKNIPTSQVSINEKNKLRNLKTDLLARIFGQEQAIDTVSSAIWRARAGLNGENRPQASFLFHGPTGVGKTELAKTIAELLQIPFLRFDMSEYMEKHAVARLIGSPPGYVGYEQGGLLTDSIRKNPHAVLLLDEIEKAHPDIYNILLQVMDYATLTDNNGYKADFRHVIIIMTTNAGANEMQSNTLGFVDKGNKQASSKSTKAVENTFSPEFRNRLDAMIGFNSLGIEQMHPIVDKVLLGLKNGLFEKKVFFELTSSARDWLARKGYDPKLGARPLQRLIRTEIEDVLAKEVLFGKLTKGGKVKVIAETPEAEHLNFIFEKSKNSQIKQKVLEEIVG